MPRALLFKVSGEIKNIVIPDHFDRTTDTYAAGGYMISHKNDRFMK